MSGSTVADSYSSDSLDWDSHLHHQVEHQPRSTVDTTLYLILEDYLADDWRHHLEKEGQYQLLWHRRTGFYGHSHWKENPEYFGSNSSTNDLNSSKKTKWQQYAELYFGLILQLSPFNPEEGSHMKRLAQVHAQAKRQQNTKLVHIVQTYMDSLN